MLQSYLKIALSNLRKNRLFFIINVAGLGLGIAAFILIFEHVAFERVVNMFHKNLPTLYRMLESRPTGDVYVQMAPAIAPLVKKGIKAACPSNPFEHYFVDQKYNEQYKTEKQYSKVFALASMLAIFIVCLGLFGLTSYMTEQHTKEIGALKVLGASIAGILALVSKDFLRLVIISIVIACPVAGYLMQKWLQDFAYQTDIVWWMFAAAGGLVILLAVLTVGFQSLKAALTNPGQSLRNE